MTLLSDFAAAAIIMSFIAVFQYLMLQLVAPGTPLFEVVSGSTELNGQETANFYYEVVILWGPVIGYLTAMAFPFVRTYRRDLATARVR